MVSFLIPVEKADLRGERLITKLIRILLFCLLWVFHEGFVL